MISEVLSVSVQLGLKMESRTDRQTDRTAQCWAQPCVESLRAAALALNNNNAIAPLREIYGALSQP